MKKQNAKHEVTVKRTEDNGGEYLYFIDSVFYQQKGFKTEKKALTAGKQKAKELSDFTRAN